MLGWGIPRNLLKASVCGFLVEAVLVSNLPICRNCPGLWMGPWLEIKKGLLSYSQDGSPSTVCPRTFGEEG